MDRKEIIQTLETQAAELGVDTEAASALIGTVDDYISDLETRVNKAKDFLEKVSIDTLYEATELIDDLSSDLY